MSGLRRDVTALLVVLIAGANAYAPPPFIPRPAGAGTRGSGTHPVEVPLSARPRAVVAPGFRGGPAGVAARPGIVVTKPRIGLSVEDVVIVTKVAAKLEALRTAVDGGPEAVTRAVSEVPAAELPPELHQAVMAVPREVRAVKAVQDLRSAVATSDDSKTAALLPEVEAVDRPLAADVRRWLGYRALREGKPDVARGILGEVPPADPRVLLRDLTRTLAAAEAFGPDPGVALMVPEAPAAGVRPGVKDDPLADLPPLTEVAAVEQRCRDGLSTRLSTHAQAHQARLDANLGRVQGHVEAAREREKDPAFEEERKKEREALATIEAKLGRPLDPAERLLAQAVLRHGKTPDEAATIIKDVETTPAKGAGGRP